MTQIEKRILQTIVVVLLLICTLISVGKIINKSDDFVPTILLHASDGKTYSTALYSCDWQLEEECILVHHTDNTDYVQMSDVEYYFEVKYASKKPETVTAIYTSYTGIYEVELTNDEDIYYLPPAKVDDTYYITLGYADEYVVRCWTYSN